MSISSSSTPVIKLDLSRQKLLIKPDDPLPRFHPTPSAIMVTPIYDNDSILAGSRSGSRDGSRDRSLERPRYAYAYTGSNASTRTGRHGSSTHTGQRSRTSVLISSSHHRSSDAYEPSYIYYPSEFDDDNDESLDRLRSRRHSYRISPSIEPDLGRSPSRTPSTTDDDDAGIPIKRAIYTDSDSSRSPPSRQKLHKLRRRASSYSPQRRRRDDYGYSRSPSPSRDRYRYASGPSSRDHGYGSHDRYNRDSDYPDDDDRYRDSYSHRHSSYPNTDSRYSRSQSRPITTERERAPDDPLRTHPPDYQVQATGRGGHGRSEGGHGAAGGGHGRRSRPSNDPLAQHPPDYQVQATGHGPGGVPHTPSHMSYPASGHESIHSQGTAHGGHGGGGGGYGRHNRNSADYAYDPPLRHSQRADSRESYRGGGSIYAGGHPPTSASIYAGRSPFLPPQSIGGRSGAASFISNALEHAAALSTSSASSAGRDLGYGGIKDSDARKKAMQDAIQAYLRLIPTNPDFCLSRCSGRKKAVCIGINYVGQKDALKGCANDAMAMREFLMRQYHFPSQQILLLTDADRSVPSPTRKEMFQAMMWLVKDAKKDDSLFFHYSGHGGQSRDASSQEKDNMDEVIFPVDYNQAGDIIDDELYQSLVDHLPAGCRLTAVFDSCHSGTILDLPYLHSAHGRLRSIDHVSTRAKSRGTAPSADVICFAACKDDETSADTREGGVAVGAMSYAFNQSLEKNPHQTYEELLTNLRHILIPKYHQKAQISGTHPLDLNRQFTL